MIVGASYYSAGAGSMCSVSQIKLRFVILNFIWNSLYIICVVAAGLAVQGAGSGAAKTLPIINHKFLGTCAREFASY
jgi:hypothetical protein